MASDIIVIAKELVNKKYTSRGTLMVEVAPGNWQRPEAEDNTDYMLLVNESQKDYLLQRGASRQRVVHAAGRWDLDNNA